MEVEVLFSPAISIINNEFNDNLNENALILLKNNFNTFVFVSDNGDPKITKPFKTSDFRCYNFSYSNESIQWDLGKLNQFLLYEIIHNRNTCIYIKPQIKAFF